MPDRPDDQIWDRAEQITRQLTDTGTICGHPPAEDAAATIRALLRAGYTITPPTQPATRPADRVLWNDRGISIDEVVLNNVNVHVEQMDTRTWWIGMYRADGTYWMGNFVADSRGRMRFTEQENAGVVWDRDDTHT